MAMTKEDIERITGNTQIVLSFGARNGGFELARKIWSSVRERAGDDPYRVFFADKGFVYLDAETLQNEPGTRNENGKVLNDNWQEVYGAAMKKANAILFVVTKEWLDSEWCWQEWEWYCELKNEPGKGITPKFLVEEKIPDAVFERPVKDNAGAKHDMTNLRTALINHPERLRYFSSRKTDEIASLVEPLLSDTMFGGKK